jgi:dihydroflavonol-4-reductase
VTSEPAQRRKVLVMGASGFVGSHVTRKLVERGDDVRVYLRKSSNTVAIDDLDVERSHGDLRDAEAMRAAMADRDVVFYCVVDTRFYLRAPAPLFETNVESLRRVLDVASQADLFRFVFCSTIGTIAIAERGESATEDMPFNWAGVGGPYIESRRQAENMVLDYAKNRGLPAVAMCVSNPYGPLDFQPSQGQMIKSAALGKMPAYVKGVCTEVVGVEDVAEAFLLAGERGGVGERYIISETFMPMREMLSTAATAVGAKPPRFGVPLALLYAVGWVMGMAGRVLRRDLPMNVTGVRLLHMMSAADHSKATRELGWQPRPTAESIRWAARFYVEQARQRS